LNLTVVSHGKYGLSRRLETSPPHMRGIFATTRWTLVLAAGDRPIRTSSSPGHSPIIDAAASIIGEWHDHGRIRHCMLGSAGAGSWP
jgi:hypothetical protein